MQKVEGSSPFIRFKEPAGNGGFFCWRTVIAWWLLPPAVIGLLALSFQRAIRVA